MPDISMCTGVGCKVRDQCYRFTAKPSKYLQSYFVTPPCSSDGEACEYRMGAK
jgi:hypothetical protein